MAEKASHAAMQQNSAATIVVTEADARLVVTSETFAEMMTLAMLQKDVPAVRRLRGGDT